MAKLPTQLIALISIAAVHFVLREATLERATQKRNGFYFPPGLILRGAFWLGTPTFLYLAIKTATELRSGSSLLLPAIYIGLASLAFFGTPGTIIVGNSGVLYTRYLGLNKTLIGWGQVRSVVSSQARREISVYSDSGASIVHSQFNVDPKTFADEVSRRSGVSVTTF